jgi:hypothetical protein
MARFDLLPWHFPEGNEEEEEKKNKIASVMTRILCSFPQQMRGSVW